MTQKSLMLVTAVALAAGGTASAQSLSTGFSGGVVVSTTGANTGNMFDITALNPGGITVDSFDIHSREAAGVPIDVDVYYIPSSFVGFEFDPTGWTLLGSTTTTTAGPLQPTPLPVGGLNIPAGATYGIYINIQTAGASVRYYSQTQLSTMTDPANDDLRIHIVDYGTANNGLFGSIFRPRGWNGTVYYTPHGVVAEGACCLPDGTCEIMGEVSCTSAGGTYNGNNTDCGTIPPCPQPGACCLPEGGCTILSDAQCQGVGGTYNGNGTTCAAAGCPGGGCCLADGSCVFTIESLCTSEFGGTFWGNGTTCGDQRCATLPVLWDNGPTVTQPFFGCSGGDLSELDQAVGTNTYGFGWVSTGQAVADNFTVPAGESWTIEQVVLLGYQTDATTVTINFAGVQIWDGVPGEPGSNVVAGDVTANSLASATFTDIYRALSTDPFNCQRRLQKLVVDLPVTLGPGTYWVEASTNGTAASGPWAPPVKFANRAAKPFADGRQRVSTGWQDLIDGGSASAQQETPFQIIGTVGAACYANCDGSTVQPVLNVDDFTCFINAFAAAQALPHQQQLTHYANCDGSTTSPVLNVDDFTCFINEFAGGCP